MACSVIRDAKTGEILKVLAPNGKESKLFKDILPLVDNNKAEALRLWAQVYTPTFKSWFGDSKVVDENREPALVYHHSASEINEFKKELSSVGGFYFSKSPNTTYKETIGSNRYPVFLSIKNPSVDEGLQSGEVDKKQIDRVLIPQGIDGINGLGNEEWVAFEPGQIKSLFNKGGFSSYSDNIYEQKLSTYDDIRPIDLTVKTLLDKLSHRFNIPYQIVDEPNANWAGRFDKR